MRNQQLNPRYLYVIIHSHTGQITTQPQETHMPCIHVPPHSSDILTAHIPAAGQVWPATSSSTSPDLYSSWNLAVNRAGLELHIEPQIAGIGLQLESTGLCSSWRGACHMHHSNATGLSAAGAGWIHLLPGNRSNPIFVQQNIFDSFPDKTNTGPTFNTGVLKYTTDPLFEGRHACDVNRCRHTQRSESGRMLC